METINSTSAGYKSWTCFTPITFQPPSFGVASNCVLRYPFPLSVKFASTLPQANQRSVAEVESSLQPRTDETYKSKLGPVCFFQQAKFPWFTFCVSLTCHFVAHSLDHPKTSPKFAYKYKGKINKRSNRRQQAKEDIKINKKKIYAKTNYKVNKNI